jgi:hypothetical protein
VIRPLERRERGVPKIEALGYTLDVVVYSRRF